MDDQWVEQLVRSNRSALLGYIHRHVANREDAADLLQDVFMSCYRHKDSFDPERCSETAWLFVIAKKPAEAILPGSKAGFQSGRAGGKRGAYSGLVCPGGHCPDGMP